jgi:hypothetical protein
MKFPGHEDLALPCPVSYPALPCHRTGHTENFSPCPVDTSDMYNSKKKNIIKICWKFIDDLKTQKEKQDYN